MHSEEAGTHVEVRAAWHDMLHDNDETLRRTHGPTATLEAIAALEDRLAAATAARHVLTEAVLVRDGLLREQLARTGELAAQLERARAEIALLRRPLAEKASSRARRVVRDLLHR
ncbi:hypothetical protein J1G44_12460 [Cellulomonas sp. zg-ZUI199]|uniref:Uncharacterized protein n=1 Tax=Cellulomonas wangleii TaxID=2816956 RepID=A0ABX8D417_9CELL|nr:hypothetical protein [Cellulomonas wangleii]MBO0925289.1 hypothetical protein [Cellulomonas wangleii]QVI61211.1 hypothetical protein KG103_11965 [Cellulomonas wangleii]